MLEAVIQQSQRVEGAQNRIDGALFKDQPAFPFGLHRLGDFVAVDFPAGAGEHRQEDERTQPGHEFLTEFAPKGDSSVTRLFSASSAITKSNLA